jgi:ABC-type amino acid transport system permease subunit
MGGVELATMAAVAKKFVDFVRQLRGRDVSAVLTQLLAWVSGIVVVYLTAHVDFASAIEFANVQLDHMSLWTQTILGVLVGSVGSVVKDGFKAVDNTQTEASPSLTTGAAPRDVR